MLRAGGGGNNKARIVKKWRPEPNTIFKKNKGRVSGRKNMGHFLGPRVLENWAKIRANEYWEFWVGPYKNNKCTAAISCCLESCAPPNY